MRVALAYLSIVLLWATTPLTIKWSGEGTGFIFGVMSRMTLGTVYMLLLLTLRRQQLPMHSKAKRTYFAVATQLYACMASVYWGAQFIPSGWISVIFGLSPFLTAFFAAIWLKEHSFSVGKVFSYLLGLTGLTVMFSSALAINRQAVYGMIAILIAVSIQTASAVWVKRIQAKLPATTQVTGGLLFALPVYLITWVIIDDAVLPPSLSQLSFLSILYLGLIATTIGFVLYYYVLIHLPATTVGMIPLISPIIALYLGHSINNETITLKIIIGTVLILTALCIHQFFDRLLAWFFKPKKGVTA
ncbi:MAG: DMT family transporter, partial [Methylococcales bacterium]|nr:DMT family transporter [Methylococcales bacterium]